MNEQPSKVLDVWRRENAEAHAETRRHMDIFAEELRQELRLLAEAIVRVSAKIDDIDSRVERIADLACRVTRLEAQRSHR